MSEVSHWDYQVGQSRFEAHTGKPSWHQARAGAISSGITVFGTKDQAEQYVRNYKASHPGEPAFVITKS